MKITRREFLKWAAASAAAIGLSQLDILRLEKVMADSNSPAVIWIQGASCTGCSISLLNVTDPATADVVLTQSVSMKYHPNLSAAAGKMAMDKIEYEMVNKLNNFILIVEGGVPQASNGKYCIIGEKADGTPWTMYQAVLDLSAKAKYVIAAGTCAAYGGVAAATPNPTGIVRLDSIVASSKIVNLPGCPIHPSHLVHTILDLATTGLPALDSDHRPTEFFSDKLHTFCPRRGSAKATKIGDPGCLLNLGCKGPGTNTTCPNMQWNNKTNWCIKAGHPCIGCAQPGFPDAVSPIYKF